jgi:cytochrome c
MTWGKTRILMVTMLGLMALRSLTFAAAGDPAKGKQVFAACAACHAPEHAVPTGPTLNGVVGRKAGTLAGFRYSRAMKNARWIWNEETLNTYLADPQAALPGNAMPYPGLPDEGQRQDVIAYLTTLSARP